MLFAQISPFGQDDNGWTPVILSGGKSPDISQWNDLPLQRAKGEQQRLSNSIIIQYSLFVKRYSDIGYIF